MRSKINFVLLFVCLSFVLLIGLVSALDCTSLPNNYYINTKITDLKPCQNQTATCATCSQWDGKLTKVPNTCQWVSSGNVNINGKVGGVTLDLDLTSQPLPVWRLRIQTSTIILDQYGHTYTYVYWKGYKIATSIVGGQPTLPPTGSYSLGTPPPNGGACGSNEAWPSQPSPLTISSVPPFCGNTVPETGEECDLGMQNGKPGSTCSLTCKKVISQTCGNGIIEGTEKCDWATTLPKTLCSQLNSNYKAGSLSCKYDCTYDESLCKTNICGNGIIESPESCDFNSYGQAIFGSETCQKRGFTGGTLKCKQNIQGVSNPCTIDTSSCTGNTATKTIYYTKTGAGLGTVTSSPSGLNCGSSCFASFTKDSQVTLTASATTGNTFTSWGGSCQGTFGNTCILTMNDDKGVSANFDVSLTNTLTTSVSGPGTLTGSGINCPGTCSKTYNGGTSVLLTANPSTGASFTGWSGACSNVGSAINSCAVTLDTSKSVGATFTQTDLCGDGIIEYPEQCDGSNLNGQTGCYTYNPNLYSHGTLGCYSNSNVNKCQFDVSQCRSYIDPDKDYSYIIPNYQVPSSKSGLVDKVMKLAQNPFINPIINTFTDDPEFTILNGDISVDVKIERGSVEANIPQGAYIKFHLDKLKLVN